MGGLAVFLLLMMCLRKDEGGGGGASPPITPPWNPFPPPGGDKPPTGGPPIVVPPAPPDEPPPPIIVDPPIITEQPPIVVQPPGGGPPVVVVPPPPSSPPPTTPTGRPTLREGSTGPDVVDWQTIVGVPADGKFGPATKAATVKWQAARGLQADGIVGPKSWAAAEAGTPPIITPSSPPPSSPPTPRGRATIKQGSTGPDVTYWQTIIGVPADGKFGPATKAATVAWQKARGLTADGIVGPNTWSAAETGTPPISTTPPPWPQQTPADLPPFPGAGWTFDQPPPQAVQTRAAALLPQLWAKGQGTKQQEKTGGRWITYRAELTGPQKKKGIVAYRLTSPGATTSASA